MSLLGGLLRGQAVRNLTLVLTEECCCRCLMCDLWERRPPRSLSREALRSLLSARGLGGVRHVALTGGEPFLRPDLAEVLADVRQALPKAAVTLSTNGVPAQAIRSFLASPSVRSGVSLEVSLLGLDAHERMTGGAARHGTVAQTLELVRRDFPAVPVRVKYVLTPWNHGDLLPLARWCRGRGLPLLVKLVESVASYTNALRHAENERSARFSFDPAARVEALAALEEILRDGLAEPAWARFAARCLEGDAPEGACRVPESSLFILSDGKVYGCRNLPPLGDLDAEGLDAILARRQRTPAGAGGREACGSCRSVFRVLFG